MKNKKTIIALGALAVVGLVAGTIAYFTSEVSFDNVFSTAIYKTKSTEVFESPDNWVPGQEVPKTVITENQGTVPVAVRVKTTETWKDERGNTIDPSVISTIENSLESPKKIAILNLDNTDDWTYDSATNAYYFHRALAKADTTGEDPVYDKTNSFLKSVTLNPSLPVTQDCTTNTDDETHTITKTCSTFINNLGKATYTLKVTVETVQYDQYKTVWFADDEENEYANAVVITES